MPAPSTRHIEPLLPIIVNASATASVAQVRLSAPQPAAVAASTATASAAQIRLRAPLPVPAASSTTSAPTTQVRVGASQPGASATSANISAVLGQAIPGWAVLSGDVLGPVPLQANAPAARVTVGSFVANAGVSYTTAAPAAQVRAGTFVPAASASSTATTRAGQVRAGSSAASTSITFFTISAVLGQAIPGWAVPGEARFGPVPVQANAPAARVTAQSNGVSASASSTAPAFAAQVRVRSAPPQTTLGATPPAAQIRVLAFASRSATANVTSPTARVVVSSSQIAATVGAFIVSTSASVRVRTPPSATSSTATAQAGAATVRVSAPAPGLRVLVPVQTVTAGWVRVGSSAAVTASTFGFQAGMVAPRQLAGVVSPQQEEALV